MKYSDHQVLHRFYSKKERTEILSDHSQLFTDLNKGMNSFIEVLPGMSS